MPDCNHKFHPMKCDREIYAVITYDASKRRQVRLIIARHGDEASNRGPHHASFFGVMGWEQPRAEEQVPG